MGGAFHVIGFVWACAALLVLGLGLAPLPILLLGIALLCTLLPLRRRPAWALPVVAALLGCMLSLTLYSTLVVHPEQAYGGQTVPLRGTILERTDTGRITLLLANDLPRGLAGRTARLGGWGEVDGLPGEVVTCEALLQARMPKTAFVQSEWAFEGRLTSDVRMIRERDDRPRAFLARGRDQLYRSLTAQVPGNSGAVLGGITLGKTDGISRALREDFSKSGLSHLLSASGLHLSLLTAMVARLLTRTRLSRRARTLWTMLIALLFMGLAGFSASITRAGVMLLLYQTGDLLGEERDSLGALGFAMVILLLQNPYAVFSLSLQLSYLATLSILLFERPICRALTRMLSKRTPKSVRTGLSTSLAATLGTLPVTGYAFGQFSLLAPVANLLVLPLTPFVLGFGLVGGALNLIEPLRAIGILLIRLAGYAATAIVTVASLLGRLPGAAVPLQDGYLLIWFAGALMLAWLLIAGRATPALGRYTAAMLLLCLLTGALSNAVFAGDSMRMLAVGNSLAFCYGKQGAVLGTPNRQSQTDRLARFLHENGVEQLSLYVGEQASHLNARATLQLLEQFSPGERLSLDQGKDFRASLFGAVTITNEGDDALRITVGEVSMVKSFSSRVHHAHLLVNTRGEWIAAPGFRMPLGGYDGATRITLRRAESERIKSG